MFEISPQRETAPENPRILFPNDRTIPLLYFCGEKREDRSTLSFRLTGVRSNWRRFEGCTGWLSEGSKILLTASDLHICMAAHVLYTQRATKCWFPSSDYIPLPG